MSGTGEIEDRKARARAWFESLRDRICAAFEARGRSDRPVADRPPGRFERKAWDRAPEEAKRPAAA